MSEIKQSEKNSIAPTGETGTSVSYMSVNAYTG
jgi:hypothetical protein